MSDIISIINIAAPLLVVSLGALISEYAGRMAMFLEYTINMGAFFCYSFCLATGNISLAMILSVTICVIIVIAFEKTSSHFNANMFLVSLAMNMIFGAAVTLMSSIAFDTRGVLYSDSFKFDSRTMKTATSIACYVVAALQILMLKFTTLGLTLRITGSDAQVLEAQGIKAAKYRTISWIFAAADAALCGCVLAARISSYVPGLSSGRGWTALAAVFFGRKRPSLVVIAVLVFAISEWASTNIQNFDSLRNVPTSLLLALPYITALSLIALVPQKNQ